MNKFFIGFCLLALSLMIFSGAGCGPSPSVGTPGPGIGTGATDWCKPGTSWSWSGATENEIGQASWIIKGLEPFKGDTYCHVTLSSSGTDQENVVIEYYFKQVNGETTDIWMITKDKTTGNQTSEFHVTGQA